MKLRSISAVGLKGPDFSHQLSDATAIIGPNAAGKTRILQAIRLALGGYLPECGKTPRATWELASSHCMEVRVEFEEMGGAINRRWWLDGNTVKVEAGFANLPSAEPFESLPLLNAEAYFELTDSKRTEYVFERIKLPDSYTPAAIIAECERISFEEEHTEQIQEAKAAIIRKIADYFVGRVDTMQEGLAKAIEDLRTQFTYWNTRAKNTQGAVTTLAELKLRENSVVAAARGVDQEIEKAQGELERISGEKGKLQQKQDEAERTRKRKAQIRKELDADRIDYQRSTGKVRDQIKLAQGKLVPVQSKGALDEMRASLRDSELTLRKIVTGLEQQDEIIAKAQQRLSELAEMKCCPWCKSKGKGWQANLEEELNATVKKAEDTRADSEKLAAGLKQSILLLEPDIASNEAVAQTNQELNSSIRDYEARAEQLQKDQALEEQRRQQLQDELDGLGVLPEEEAIGFGLADLVSDISVQRRKLAELQDKKDAETRLQQQLVSAAQAELEHQDASAHVTVIKAIAKLLKEKREAMIEEAFGGLLNIANKLTAGILKAPLALHENTIGMWLGAKFVPHRVLSGTEKALAYIAIAVALSSTAPLKLVILDEFGRLDEENQMKVLLRLSLLVLDEVIDQFIVVGTSLPKALKSSTEASQVHLEVIEV